MISRVGAKVFLIVGGESDPNNQRIVDQAHIRGIDYLFWNTDDPDCLNIAWDFDRLTWIWGIAESFLKRSFFGGMYSVANRPGILPRTKRSCRMLLHGPKQNS